MELGGLMPCNVVVRQVEPGVQAVYRRYKVTAPELDPGVEADSSNAQNTFGNTF